MLTRDDESPRRPYSLPSYSREASQTACFATLPTLALGTLNFSAIETSSLLQALVDALPQGFLVLSVDRTIVYWNQSARNLCQTFSSTQHRWTALPDIMTELCAQMLTSGTTAPMLLDYELPDRRSFRLTASWLTGTRGSVEHPFHQQTYILITVEDRDAVLRQDIQIEQKKFQLTNREAEIWLLLKQEYSYQAIAKTLHISLNTVKTHIRNIHAKRHPYQSLPA